MNKSINKGLSFQEVLGVLDETEECTMKKEKLKTKYFKNIVDKITINFYF